MIISFTENIFQIWVGLLGAVVGSFINVLVYRIPRGFKVSLPGRSLCIRCKEKIRWYDNIPVLSYFFLLGRCRKCGTKISFRYVLVEIITALMFVSIYRNFSLSFETFYYCLFSAMLIAVTFIDLEHYIIPDAITFPGMFLGLIGSVGIAQLGITSSLLGGFIGGAFLWVLGFIYEKLAKREGLGFGDVKLLAMIGFFLGPTGTLLTVGISSLVGSVMGLAIMVIQKKNTKMAIPYGPFLSIGALITIFWGDFFALKFYPLQY